MAKNLVGDRNWGLFKDRLEDAHETFQQDTIIWRRYLRSIDRFQEDHLNAVYEDRSLKMLFQENTIATWPTSITTVSGESEAQNAIMWINKRYLADQGWLTSTGYIDFNPGKDYFVHKGQVWRNRGGSQAIQAFDDTQLIFLVLRRDVHFTGDPLFNPTFRP